MKQHLSKYWLYYFAIAVCIWFIYKLSRDNIGGAGNAVNSTTAPTSLDYNKTLTTGSNSEEVRAAQAYINMNMDSPTLQADPLTEDGILGVNTSHIISALQVCAAGGGIVINTATSNLSEIINLTDAYNCET
jgi:hypothetical protein